MWGIIPAAGAGTRIQPLAFSKELLPVGSRFDGPVERPRAVSEHLVERMLAAGATKLCFIISPGKSDILEYYAGQIGEARICYLVQRQPAGLCDAIFQAAPFIRPDEPVIVGLPDTLWYPVAGLRYLPDDGLSFLLFPVDRPELFDAVVTDAVDDVVEIRVKQPAIETSWVWGAFKMPGAVFHELHRHARQRVHRAWRPRQGDQSRTLVRGCRHVQRLSRGERAARAAARRRDRCAGAAGEIGLAARVTSEVPCRTDRCRPDALCRRRPRPRAARPTRRRGGRSPTSVRTAAASSSWPRHRSPKSCCAPRRRGRSRRSSTR